MNTRPLSVTIISWLLIASAAISIVSMPFTLSTEKARQIMALSPLPIEAQIAISVIGATITLTCGVFMLRGRDWARKLYVAFGAIGILIGLVISPAKSLLLINVIFIAVVSFFLFRGTGDRFFRPETTDAPIH